MNQTHLRVSLVNATPQLIVSNIASKKTWKARLEENPLRCALLIIVTTASITAGIMGWIQAVRLDLATTKYETERAGLKNDYEGQIRVLKNKIAELEKKGK